MNVKVNYQPVVELHLTAGELQVILKGLLCIKPSPDVSQEELLAAARMCNKLKETCRNM